MADAADIAGDEIDRWLNEVLAAAVEARLEAGQSRFFCVDCDDPIPQGRRDAVPGCVRCIECEEMVTGGSRRG